MVTTRACKSCAATCRDLSSQIIFKDESFLELPVSDPETFVGVSYRIPRALGWMVSDLCSFCGLGISCLCIGTLLYVEVDVEYIDYTCVYKHLYNIYTYICV